MGGLRVEAVPGFDRHAASETSVCSYDGSIDDDCKPVFQNTSWAAGDLSDGSMLQNSPSVGTATDSFESSCGAITPLSWSAFNAQAGIDMGQEEPAYGDAPVHALWPSTQQLPDEPTPFIPVPTSHFDPIPRSTDGLPLPPPEEEYQTHSQHYYHQEQQPIPITPYRPGPFNTPLIKDHTMTDQFQLPTDILPLSYHINPTPNTYYAEYIHRHPKLAFANDSSPEQPTTKTIPCQIDTRNALLIEYKRRGLSYKDIKRIGGFREAESTLRGRFRTLTKAKDQRVRKPMWSEKDVCPPSLPLYILSSFISLSLSRLCHGVQA
ncbi:hypothetical protein P168DRAFT_287485 [Aspergillus campestris IBT 28561]|uniref:Uncharacterized protein n=1 Tax=Aspergillus campestris (strain IBT 28561) TaxID=1392248 RepID=A0A2I1DAR4_ASPC2|nr:uncharacterized protein P168DRAFT_287485 [Aspergillus campestris IBT 28561]PKY06964.1 hypothetical protein P168DRAFT_287485 [Aspergillus campestris IBT 28561]